jgi:hypothetical protein
MAATRDKGVSLAKGPVGIIGMILLAYGVTALVFGGGSFTQDEQVDQASRELPDHVDTEQHADLLQKFGLDPQDVLGKLGGGVPGL